MHFGLIISLGLHTALLGWAVLNIQMLAPLRVAEPEPIAVDLVTPGEITKLRLGLRTAKQLQAQPKESPRPDVAKKEAAKPTPVAAAPPPPAPEPAAAKEEPKPEPPKPEPPKPEPPKAELPPKPEPPPKSEPPKDPGADKLAALPPEAAAVPPVPAIDEQQKLEEMLKEQQRQADEHTKLEEEKRKIEEEKRKLEEEKRKLEEDTRKAEEKKQQEDEERKQAELKRKQEEEKRRKEAELKKKREEEKRRKEAEAKKKFDAEKISALLNKMPDKGRAATVGAARRAGQDPQQGPGAGRPRGARPAAFCQRTCHSGANHKVLCAVEMECARRRRICAEHPGQGPFALQSGWHPGGRTADHEPAEHALLPGGAGQCRACGSGLRTLQPAAGQV